ncbi:MAG: divergent polysaccharide deacetylase family protein [Rhodospirillaceae bacterium]
MGLFDRFRKDSVKDPFGGGDDGEDDFYDDDDARQSGAGPKIALLASGVVFAGVVGFISYVLMTSETPQVAAPVTGSFADLQVDDGNEPAPAAGNEPAVAADVTAATDRSASRRPWLTAQAPASPESSKPAVPPPAAAKPQAAKPEAAKPDAAKPAVTPPANTAAVTPPPAPAPAPAAAKPAAPVAAPPAKETQVAVAAAPTSAKPAAPPAPVPAPPANAKPTATTPPGGAKPEATPAEAPATPGEEAPNLIAGIPALNAPGVAPGAPERFTAAGDAGPATAGGRPRLVDPPLPPTDRVAVSAPPPRFAALRDAKKEASAAAPASTAKIAIVVRGLGLSQSATEAAITKLPAAVTLAFSPYARNIKTWMDRAKAAGHEVLIEVPLESKDFPAQDPGPLGLLTTLELKDNTERLDAVLKTGAGAIGVFDAQGTKFRENAQSITPMFAKLKEQNLFYVQGSPGVRMGDAYVSTAVADVVLDERPFRAAVDARLDYAERLARYQGSVVASVQAKPVSFERLILWLEQAQKKGIALTPISTVLIRSEIAAPPPAATPAAANAKPAGEHDAPAKAKPEAAKAKPAAAKAKPEAAKAKAKPAH